MRTHLPPKKGHSPPFFGPCPVAKRLDGSRCHLVVGTEVHFGPGHIVLDMYRDPAHPLLEGAPNFRPMFAVAKRLVGSGYATFCGGRPRPSQHCVRCGPSSPKGAQPPILDLSIVAKRSPIQLLLSTCTNGRPKITLSF